MKKNLCAAVTVLLIVSTLRVNAQEQEDAFQIWSCVKMDKSLGKEKRWNVGVMTEYRHQFHEGVAQTNRYFVRPSVAYKALPWLSLKYQMDFATTTSGFSMNFIPEISLSHKAGNFAFSYRQRVQTTWKARTETNISVLRSRAKMEYSIPKTPLGLYVSTEPYWCEFSKDSFAWFQKLRTHAGLSLRLDERTSLYTDYGWMAYFNRAGRNERRTYDDQVLYLTLAVKL